MATVPMSAADLAVAIEKWTGVDASVYAAERLDAMSIADDASGVRRIEEVAACRSERRNAAARSPRLS